jgi:hypothetical protein
MIKRRSTWWTLVAGKGLPKAFSMTGFLDLAKLRFGDVFGDQFGDRFALLLRLSGRQSPNRLALV